MDLSVVIGTQDGQDKHSDSMWTFKERAKKDNKHGPAKEDVRSWW